MIKLLRLLSLLIVSLLISCSVQAPPPPYYTLTLNIKGERPQVLYYGKETEKWYKKLSREGLLVDENVIEGDDIKFYIRDNKGTQEKKWTVSFEKNLPKGASSSDLKFTGEYNGSTVDTNIDRLEFFHYPELYIPNNLYFDIEGERKGIVKVNSLDRSKTINGYYEPINQTFRVVIDAEDYTKYPFKGWILNGNTILPNKYTHNFTFTIDGDTTLYADYF